jgi:hypothetical protein
MLLHRTPCSAPPKKGPSLGHTQEDPVHPVRPSALGLSERLWPSASENAQYRPDRGARLDNARIQSPLCGPSRMSTYTGRYVHSHGASWNNVPLNRYYNTFGNIEVSGRAVLFIVGGEACGSAHHWTRELIAFGRDNAPDAQIYV